MTRRAVRYLRGKPPKFSRKRGLDRECDHWYVPLPKGGEVCSKCQQRKPK